MPADREITAEYLIVGGGALGMAIADTLIGESDSSVIMVDRRHKPGGHWHDAYPFVRLHGPSANYGVNSRQLGSDRIDEAGLNRGLFELATGSEIRTYFDEAMRHGLLPTGRMHYLPMHEYNGDGQAVSLISGQATKVSARKKIVDATIAETQVPSRTSPNFSVAEGATLIPPNGLAELGGSASTYVIIGAGKTAIDAVTWLMENDVDPGRLKWIRPRDPWLLNRKMIQPSYDFFENTIGWLIASMEAAANADTVDDIFLHLESAGCMHRIDTSVIPTMYRCAIVSEMELDQLRLVKDVVRMGHVRAIADNRVVLDDGELDLSPGTLFVNCSADGIPRKPVQPIFQPGKIVPQYVRACSPTFSGALVAKVELLFGDDEEKNALTRPTPIPDSPADWVQIELNQALNSAAWRENKALSQWLAGSRLDQFTAMMLRAFSEGDEAKIGLLDRYRTAIRPAVERMGKMVAASTSA
ncbi:MAG TPA: NAD(P)-binding protein [Pseudomonadales bacterium]